MPDWLSAWLTTAISFVPLTDLPLDYPKSCNAWNGDGRIRSSVDCASYG